MDWIASIATSEFVWGIIIGLLLAIVVAAVTIRLDSYRRRRIVAAFCQDLVGSVCDLIQNLEDNRDRNRVIDHEFLGTIAAEIVVYGRNREHLVFLNDAELRKDVRLFFTRVAALLAQIQWRLKVAQDAFQLAEHGSDERERKDATEVTEDHLGEAHTSCDRLRELLSQRKSFEERLESSSRLFS